MTVQIFEGHIRTQGQFLKALRKAGKTGITTLDGSDLAPRYGGHLGSLYKKGFLIESTPLGDGLWNYTLIHEPKQKVKRKHCKEVFFEAVEDKLGNSIADSIKALMDEVNVELKYKGNHYKALNKKLMEEELAEG